MNKKQLIQEITSKKDDRDYRLILDLDGIFRLIDLNNWKDDMIYVTRWETYNCGEGFVGIDALADEIFIDGIYSWAEEAWNIHKNTGEINIINPYI